MFISEKLMRLSIITPEMILICIALNNKSYNMTLTLG